MSNITVSAPGKIHLLGEHSVVYGYPSLLASVDKRLYVSIKYQESDIKNNSLLLHTKENAKLVKSAINVFQNAFAIDKLPPLEITINSSIPSGSGMGSSAAVCAAVIGALMKTIKNIWNPHIFNNLTYKTEKIAHGNPSGADNTTVVFGGLVWFRREFEFLKSIWSLPVSSYKIPKFMMADSGKPVESTKEMVAIVQKNYKKRKKYINGLFNDQETQTKKILLSLKENDAKSLQEAIIQGEGNLEKIGVVGKQAKEIIRCINQLGGAAKICGAGGIRKGSGIILCYHQNLQKLIPVEKKLGIKLENISLAGEGIRLEKQQMTKEGILN